MSEETQLTTLGNLDPKLASALCYVPLMSINLIASLAFFFTEKDIKPVRFHAAQGLLLAASIMASGVLLSVLVMVGTIGGSIVDAMLDTGGMLSLLFSLLILLATLVFALFVMVVPLGLAFFAYSGNNTRVPVLAGFAEKLAGLEPGWAE